MSARRPATHWAVLTGEYPPQPGGVADYTRLVVNGLACGGDRVTVYAPPHPGAELPDSGVTVHRLPDHFGPRGLVALHAALTARPRPDRLLVQYTPQAFGYKGMNLPFALWLAYLGRRTPVWVMFHEVACPLGRGQTLKYALLGHVTRRMARLVAGTADRLFVSVPSWGPLLRELGQRRRPAEWLPVPSNLPTTVDVSSREAIRGWLAPRPETTVIGHFGTFGGMNSGFVEAALVPVLRRSPTRIGLLVGRGSDQFREQLVTEHRDLAARVLATGALSGPEAAAYLTACDLLIQPYPDGVSARRGSAMAGLALGVPTVTNTGFLSEPIWGTESAGVAVTPSPQPGDFVPAIEALLALPSGNRAEMGRAAATWYRSHFALECTIARLLSTEGPPDPRVRRMQSLSS
jgi:hypothetical protein